MAKLAQQKRYPHDGVIRVRVTHEASMADEKLCAWVFDGSGGIRCLCTVHRGSRYCWIHHEVINGPEPKRKRPRQQNHNADLLPYSEVELRQLAELRDKTK